jgi:predicted nucleic acid-binding protein
MQDSRPAYWDTSALVFLCVYDRNHSLRFHRWSRQFPRKVAWWATGVEIASAIARLRRLEAISDSDAAKATVRADLLWRSWAEIQPTDELRAKAVDLLKQTDLGLRAPDALQLASALMMCGGHVKDRVFVSHDAILADAAAKEGFVVYR